MAFPENLTPDQRATLERMAAAIAASAPPREEAEARLREAIARAPGELARMRDELLPAMIALLPEPSQRRRQLRDLRDGVRILASRDFWSAFRAYWSPMAIAGRLDEWTARARENTGQEPDWDVERRRARRRVGR